VSLGSSLRSENQNFHTSQLKMCHDLALMGLLNLIRHHDTNHWSQWHDMKLLGRNRYDAMTERCVSFGSSSLRSENQNFHRFQLKMCHGLGLMGHLNLIRHHDTNHWSHRHDMKLLGRNRYGVMAERGVSFGSSMRSENQNFHRFQLKMCHGLALMSLQNLIGHHDTNHWSHRHDMKLLGSNRYGVRAERCVSFGSSWRSENQIFCLLTYPSSSQCAMAWH
jgi:hypothetical protein